MEYFSTEKTGKVFMLRLDAGEMLLESIVKLIEKEKIKNGMVISGIGTLDYCVLHMVTTTSYPPVEHFEKWNNKPLELAALQGIIADGVPHLHVVVSDKKKAYAGHLETNCRVLYLAEVVIIESNPMNLVRIPDEKNIKKLKKKN